MPAPFVENVVFFPLDDFFILVKDQVTIGIWVHFWVFNSIPLIYVSVTVPVPCSFYHKFSVVQLEVRHGASTKVLLSLRRVFAILGFLLVQMNLQIALWIEELTWNFDGDYTESVDCFWKDGHFYYINPADPWAWKIFPSTTDFFNFFLQRFEVLVLWFFSLPWIESHQDILYSLWWLWGESFSYFLFFSIFY